MKSRLVFFARYLALTFWHFMSLMLSALVIGSFVNMSDPGQAPVGLAPILLVSLLETVALLWLILRMNLTGLKLFWVVLVVFHSTKVFLMMIEAAFFLNIWTTPPMIGLERVFALEVHGLLMALLFCPVAILVLKKWQPLAPVSPDIFPVITRHLVLKLLWVSVIYAACYWLAGAFVLIPLAGDSFQFTYGHLQVPLWMPLFQVGRGVFWAFIVLLLVRHLRLQGGSLYFGVGLLVAVLAGSQLLVPNPYMLDHLRYAHLVEISMSMVIFGALASWMLRAERDSASKVVNVEQ